MKFDVGLFAPKLTGMADFTRATEAMGFDGIWASETNADPFLPLAVAAEHSRRLSLGTAIALAFPRSPMTLAYLAWDLARFSNGRFILGLGTQVRSHNEQRFGVKWEKPVRRMRETIEAIHAIWACWQDGVPLNYQGEFFQLTLMLPPFSGGRLLHGPPPIYIAAVNQNMLRLAGRLCAGVHIHPFRTVRYLRDFALPEIAYGLRDSGRDRDHIQLASSIFVVPTDDIKPASYYERYAKQQLSFYMSTPEYQVVVALHGWTETALKLQAMIQRREWGKMADLISDDMLEAFAVSGTWTELPGKINQQYGGLLDRVGYYLPFVPGDNDDAWRSSIAAFKALSADVI